jgi:hypothetical protein
MVLGFTSSTARRGAVLTSSAINAIKDTKAVFMVSWILTRVLGLKRSYDRQRCEE